MSDPHHRDPRHNPLRPDQEPPPRQIMELEKSNNAIWGWIAAAVAVLLVLVFVFAGGRTDTASDGTAASPPATTGAAPQRAQPPAAAQSPKPAPGTTTGQGGTR